MDSVRLNDARWVEVSISSVDANAHGSTRVLVLQDNHKDALLSTIDSTAYGPIPLSPGFARRGGWPPTDEAEFDINDFVNLDTSTQVSIDADHLLLGSGVDTLSGLTLDAVLSPSSEGNVGTMSGSAGTRSQPMLLVRRPRAHPHAPRLTGRGDTGRPPAPIDRYLGCIIFDPPNRAAEVSPPTSTMDTGPFNNSLALQPLSNDGRSHNPKRLRLTQDELGRTKRPRVTQIACLSCYVDKKECRSGYPCTRCMDVVGRVYSSRTLRFTECFSSNLSDLNIFKLGASMPVFQEPWDNPSFGKPTVASTYEIDIKTASSTFTPALEVMYHSGLLSEIDEAYNKVLKHVYGPQAFSIHPFILRARNPLHIFVQLNVLLLGSSIVGDQLSGLIRYIQLMRAISATLAFECLGKALRRNALKNALFPRRVALIVHMALLLEQVSEMNAGAPSQATCNAYDRHYEERQRHLVGFTSYYLEKLIKETFGDKSALAGLMQKAGRRSFNGDFWDCLASCLPTLALQKPPKVRNYAGDIPSSV